MKLSLNFGMRHLVEIDNCVHFSTMANNSTKGNIITLFFDREFDRRIAKMRIEQACVSNKITEGDNTDYPDLPVCYKLYIIPFMDFYIQVNNDVIPNPFFDFEAHLKGEDALYILLKHDSSKSPLEMEIVDICCHNKLVWTNKDNYPDTIVTMVFTEEEKLPYLLKYYKSLKF